MCILVYTLYTVHVFLFVSTYLTTISTPHLTFLNVNYFKKIIRKFLRVPPGDDRIPRSKSNVGRLNSNRELNLSSPSCQAVGHVASAGFILFTRYC